MAAPQWVIELHSHTHYSHDSLTRLEDLHAIVQTHNIDKLAITDHNVVDAALELARLYPIWVIPGVEVMTTERELLGWYIKGEVPVGRSPEETIAALREQGALIGVAHPFDRYRRGAWKPEVLARIVDQVDVIEVFNARCLRDEDNAKALAFAREHNKLMAAGSDAHTRREYGRGLMNLPPFSNNAEGLRRALQSATFEGQRSSWDVHISSTYAKWVKRFVPSLRPKR
ncbi:MAG: PHP domain-containing protein [Anaerolineae bacterium]